MDMIKYFKQIWSKTSKLLKNIKRNTDFLGVNKYQVRESEQNQRNTAAMLQYTTFLQYSDAQDQKACSFLDLQQFFEERFYLGNALANDNEQQPSNSQTQIKILQSKDSMLTSNSREQKLTFGDKWGKKRKIIGKQKKQSNGTKIRCSDEKQQKMRIQQQKKINKFEMVNKKEKIISRTVASNPSPKCKKTLYKGFLNTTKLIILTYIARYHPSILVQSRTLMKLTKCRRKTNRNQFEYLINDPILYSIMLDMFASNFAKLEYQNCRVKLKNYSEFWKKFQLLKQGFIRKKLGNLS